MVQNNSNEVMFSEYPDVVSVKDLIKMLSISRSTALSLLQNQTIPNFKIGRIYKIPKKCVIKYIESQIKE